MVVLGGGIGGLLAAARLVPFFSRVSVVERDDPPSIRLPRKGTPQAAHIHLLLIRGAQAIESILPGVFDEISEAGGITADSTRDLAFFHFGAWQPRGFAKLPARLQSRPFLEWHIARRVAALPNVEIMNRHEARGLVLDGRRVCGVSVAALDEETETVVDTDLVVDATGRSSASLRWLADAGFQKPETTEVSLKITYASRFFLAPATAGAEDWRAMLVYPQAPSEDRGGALYFQEGNRWIVTMASYRGDTPPHDDEAFLKFAESLPSKEIHRLIRDAEPISEIATYSYPGAMRRHFESVEDPPERLVAIGDSVCSFNPVFGQGITSAALQVEALGACLSASGLDAIERRFSRAAARACDVPWLLSTTMDLRYPHARGKRPFWFSILNAYLKRFFRATAEDYTAMLDFMSVLHMVTPPTQLAHPRNAATVLRSILMPRTKQYTERPPLSSYSVDGSMQERELRG